MITIAPGSLNVWGKGIELGSMFSSGALLACLYMISSACHIISKLLGKTWLWKERIKQSIHLL
jgi:hypothetical protein